MEELVKLESYPVRGLVGRLLQDKTTRKNIIFASESYSDCGTGYKDHSQMTEDVLLGFDSCDIQPRVYKTASEQTKRTRKRAEVFTPAWIVNLMNNHCDAEWFGRTDVFNHQDGHEWRIITDPITFPEGKDWKQYVDSRRLEITCGEAPYIVSRYDASTGELIPIERRIGILDRKLRVVNENAADETEWLEWAFRAFQSVYGYEYQGDNLLIARMNLLYTLADYIEAMWHRQAARKELEKFLNVICWNFWQMDGLKDTPPYGIPSDEIVQLSMFGDRETVDNEIVYCKIYDWRADASRLFKNLKKRGKGMKFDYVIGNPPYQQDSVGANESDTPLYHYLYQASMQVASKVELITPARFLFNAGATPKEWNEAMLNDEHFKVLFYESKSDKVFSNKDIKGGIAITYHDITKKYGAIEVFTAFPELNSIKRKVEEFGENSLSDVVTNRGLYRYSKLAYDEQPKELAKTADARIAPSAFERMPALFTDVKPDDGYDYIQIFGLLKGERCYRWFRRDYVKEVPNLFKYKIMIPKANGSGAIGEVLSTPLVGTPLVGTPLVGFTETFISIGETDSKEEANAILKYVKTKFARTMLGILKVTQNNAKPTWKYVPLQDFTSTSDIDWSKSIAEIDRQLYKKYGLIPDEIKFIETHVKEME